MADIAGRSWYEPWSHLLSTAGNLCNRQQDYQHWYPEEVTFQPKLHESAMSREFLRKSLGADAAAILSGKPAERHTALVNRLYASYEKVSKVALLPLLISKI